MPNVKQYLEEIKFHEKVEEHMNLRPTFNVYHEPSNFFMQSADLLEEYFTQPIRSIIFYIVGSTYAEHIGLLEQVFSKPTVEQIAIHLSQIAPSSPFASFCLEKMKLLHPIVLNVCC